MANQLAIATASEALRLRLMSAISLDVTGVDVVTRGPEATDGQATSLVTVFLYRVTPNAALRNSDLPTRGSDPAEVRRRPRIALNLHYLLSFTGDITQSIPQRMLGRAVASLHAMPTLGRSELQAAGESAGLPASNVHEEVETIKLSLDGLSLDALSKLWSMFVNVPYRLSVVYEASVVLIDADLNAREPLPVQRSGVHAVPVPQPVLDDVRAAGGGTPAGGNLTLELVGRNLRGVITSVRFDGDPPLPVQSATDTRVVVVAGALKAGPHGVQVVHELTIGDPPTPHSAAESASVAFLLRPAIDVTFEPEAVPVPDPARGAIVVDFAPQLGAGQRVSLLLNEHAVPAPADRVLRFFRLEPQSAPGEGATTLRFRRSEVPAGTYLVRAQVDGADSLLHFPQGDDVEPPRPRVTLP